jgi:hypothetical protein
MTRFHGLLLVLTLSASVGGQDGQEKPMIEGKDLWWQLRVGEYGEPKIVQTTSHTREQREVLRLLQTFNSVRNADELEEVLNEAMADREKECGIFLGISRFNFNCPREDFYLWTEYDREAPEGERYPFAGVSFAMPLAEVEPLMRAWIASVRHWRNLGGEHSRHLPADKRPAAYPPPKAN